MELTEGGLVGVSYLGNSKQTRKKGVLLGVLEALAFPSPGAPQACVLRTGLGRVSLTECAILRARLSLSS